jgi:hypothetical protein
MFYFFKYSYRIRNSMLRVKFNPLHELGLTKNKIELCLTKNDNIQKISFSIALLKKVSNK